MNRVERNKKRKQNRIEKGLCGICGQKKLVNKTECLDCRDKRRERHKQAYWKGNSTKTRNSIKNRRSEWIASGLCSRCGKNTPPPKRKTCNLCREKLNAKTQDLKDKVYNAYGGYVCNCCGETIKKFLTIDHVSNNGSEHRKNIGKSSSSGRGLYLWIIKNNFPPMFQILCYNCNCGKKHNGGICPHKTE